MKIMNININFKQGLRRVIIAFIGLCILCALGVYFSCGCIFERYKYADNVKVVNTTNNKTLFLNKYLELYWHNGQEYVSNWDINCHPYKQYCYYDGWEYRRNGHVELKNDNEKIFLKIYAPSPLQYFFWQLWDFIKIFLIAILSYGVYLLIEFVFCWIIKGFKQQ